MTLETFFEKFDQFADAPNAVAKMGELVMHLAIQGKLVSQEASDEPAATLLSIIETLHANFPQITQVRFLVDGEQRDTLAGHADLTRAYLASDAPGVKHL